ncbi:hypothetical protein Vafri_11576 [Volvox africanus]|nr:hypothetical protein Vafri_11576 [Volvox africanus]
MFGHKASVRMNGTLDDPSAKAEFSRLRTRYQRLRREAKEGYRINMFEALVDKCRRDPRALWTRLESKGSPPLCPIQDIDRWATHFDRLFNDEIKQCNMDKVEEILCVINSQSKIQGKDWAKSAEFKSRSLAATFMEEPFTVVEVQKALKRLSNGKSCGFGKISTECLKKATPTVDGKEINMLVFHLHTLFEHIRSTGDFLLSLKCRL